MYQDFFEVHSAMLAVLMTYGESFPDEMVTSPKRQIHWPFRE
jgi:hypothetical protein